MMGIGLETVIVQDREPIVTTVDDEVVMLSVRAEAYFGLGSTGSEIWALIERPRRVVDVCAELVRRFDVDEHNCRQEVVAFVTALVDRGLARVVDVEPEGIL